MRNKKVLLSMGLFVFFAIAACTRRNTALAAENNSEANIPIDETCFPDSNFRSYLSDRYDEDSDGSLSRDEIDQITSIKIKYIVPENSETQEKEQDEIVSESNILDITGISYLSALENVDLEGWYLEGAREIQQLEHLVRLRLYRDKNWDALAGMDIPSLKTLIVTGNICNKIAIDYLPNLKKLVMLNLYEADEPDIQRETLNTKHNKKLEILRCEGLGLELLNIEQNPKLRKLNCSGSKLKRLNISNNPKLEYLSCDECRLTKLDTSRNPKLEYLSCERNSISVLNLSDNPKLVYLSCMVNPLYGLDITDLSDLQTLNCYWCGIDKLDLTKNIKLKDLNCSRNRLETLSLAENNKLQSLDCSQNRIRKLSLQPLKHLISADCSENRLRSLDISSNRKIKKLKISQNKIEKLSLPQSFFRNTAFSSNLRKCYRGNKIKVLDIRTVRQLQNSSGRASFKNWLRSGRQMTPWRRLRTVIVSRQLRQTDKKYVKKIAAKYKVKITYV